ncbi:MAG: cob(I)yrinic acid a,c-diamide adenosyltransferase [Saprospiraceae bacterium]|nr:cob(I)yrinic acid a,c-diamide adenosyltransferase [Saprospiraceae bacterium]
MKIYTKTGDTGQTSLYGGKRLSKSNLRVEAYGTLDELNSWLGLLKDEIHGTHIKELIKEIQDRIFTISAHIASDPEKDMPLPDIFDHDIALLEVEIDKMNEHLKPLQYFILPGGHRKVSEIHIVRTVCRRSERMIVALSEQSKVEPIIIIYLNRLSDFLFVLARFIAKELDVEETKWVPRK